jgi:ribonuclease PH
MGSGKGWVTAEYAMLPRANRQRSNRERSPSGRSQEIQRLVGRSLRAVTDLVALGEVQITLDCDVLRADGGTRCASINAAYVALVDAVEWCVQSGIVKGRPLVDSVAAVSCGIVGGETLLDLDYAEDSGASVDANFVLIGFGRLVEVQATGEEATFDRDDLDRLLSLAVSGARRLTRLQKSALRAKS